MRVHVGSHCLLCRAVRKCVHSCVALKSFLGFKDLFISFWFLFSASTLMKTSSGGASVLFLLLAHLVHPPSILPCLSQSFYLFIFKWTLAITVWRHTFLSVCLAYVCVHVLCVCIFFLDSDYAMLIIIIFSDHQARICFKHNTFRCAASRLVAPQHKNPGMRLNYRVSFSRVGESQKCPELRKLKNTGRCLSPCW